MTLSDLDTLTLAELGDGLYGTQPPCWIAGPFRLVSLLEMLEFHAGAFLGLFGAIAEQERNWEEFEESFPQHCDIEIRPNYEGVAKDYVGQILETVNSLNRVKVLCERFALDSAISQIDRIHAKVDAGCGLSELRDLFTQFRERVEDQLGNRTFLFIPIDKVKYFSKQELFGDVVGAKFPHIAYDIEEAGNCLALSRSTAAVCHLMRVIEAGVKALAGTLSATINTNASWGPILSQIDSEIEILKKSGVDVQSLLGVSASLHAVKDAWRNPAMHSESKYTEDEAEEIFIASKTFMRRLAGVV